MPTELRADRKWAVIYDDACGFCSRSVRMGRALDWLKCFDWVARSSEKARTEYAQVQPDQTARRMAAVAPDGSTHLGFYAVREIWLREPLLTLPGLLLWLPLADRLGVPVYDWVARNRYRLGGTAACEIRK